MSALFKLVTLGGARLLAKLGLTRMTAVGVAASSYGVFEAADAVWDAIAAYNNLNPARIEQEKAGWAANLQETKARFSADGQFSADEVRASLAGLTTTLIAFAGGNPEAQRIALAFGLEAAEEVGESRDKTERDDLVNAVIAIKSVFRTASTRELTINDAISIAENVGVLQRAEPDDVEDLKKHAKRYGLRVS